jgi:hypothetical protein
MPRDVCAVSVGCTRQEVGAGRGSFRRGSKASEKGETLKSEHLETLLREEPSLRSWSVERANNGQRIRAWPFQLVSGRPHPKEAVVAPPKQSTPWEKRCIPQR